MAADRPAHRLGEFSPAQFAWRRIPRPASVAPGDRHRQWRRADARGRALRPSYRRPGLQSLSLSRPAKPPDVGADAQLAQLPGRLRRRNRRLPYRRSVDRAGRCRRDRAARRAQDQSHARDAVHRRQFPGPLPAHRLGRSQIDARGQPRQPARIRSRKHALDEDRSDRLGRDGRSRTAPRTGHQRLHPGDRRAGDPRSG